MLFFWSNLFLLPSLSPWSRLLLLLLLLSAIFFFLLPQRGVLCLLFFEKIEVGVIYFTPSSLPSLTICHFLIPLSVPAPGLLGLLIHFVLLTVNISESANSCEVNLPDESNSAFLCYVCIPRLRSKSRSVCLPLTFQINFSGIPHFWPDTENHFPSPCLPNA